MILHPKVRESRSPPGPPSQPNTTGNAPYTRNNPEVAQIRDTKDNAQTRDIKDNAQTRDIKDDAQIRDIEDDARTTRGGAAR